MRLATPVLAAALLALLAGPADAKELVAARACDDDGCRTITATAALRAMEGGSPTDPPQQGAPFYRVRMTVAVEGEKGFHYTMVYVPSAGLLRFRSEGGGYDWLAATPRGKRGFDNLTHGLEPLPARRLRGVGAAAVEPAARVDEVLPAPGPARDGGGFQWIVLLIPGGAALAGAAWAARRRELAAPLRRARA